MTRLTLHTADTAPAASRAYVEKAAAANGFLPNLIGILANSPAALETYLTVSGLAARGSLSLAEREVVQITAARLHGCEFCVAGHTAAALKKAGLDAQLVVALQRGEATGAPRLDALRAFAEAVIAHRGAVADAALAAFRAAGFDDAQALEVVLGVSLATLCNFANSLAQSPINPELQAYRPGVLGAPRRRPRARRRHAPPPTAARRSGTPRKRCSHERGSLGSGDAGAARLARPARRRA